MSIYDQSLIVRNLNQIRSEFDRLRWQSSAIKAQIYHRATNAEAEGVRGIPGIGAVGMSFVGMQGAGYHDGGMRTDKNGNPKFRDDAVLDVSGIPISNSAGSNFDFVMPVIRSVTFAGENEDFVILAEIAKRAGRVIRMLSTPIISGLSDWRFSSDSDVWWAFLFELAWSGANPLLVAEKRLWLPADVPIVFIPYDLQQLQQLSSSSAAYGHSPLQNIPKNWTIRLPEAWVSHVDNAVTASIDAIDYCLNEIQLNDNSDANNDLKKPEFIEKASAELITLHKRFAVALSFPGEHRILVSKVAKELSDVFGKQKIFYDKYHQSELSCPNLDTLFQRIYSTEADLVVVFICAEYSAKEWCGVEWRAIREMIKSKIRKDEDIMYFRLDKKEIPGVLSIDGYIDISNEKKPRNVANHVISRWISSR